jgi:hypothetical protein
MSCVVMHFKSILTTGSLCFPQKSYTLAGFEPESSTPGAHAMTTAICFMSDFLNRSVGRS